MLLTAGVPAPGPPGSSSCGAGGGAELLPPLKRGVCGVAERWAFTSVLLSSLPAPDSGLKGSHVRQDSMEPSDLWDDASNCRCGDRLKTLEQRARKQHHRCLAHSLVGTPNYIAPEVLLRKGRRCRLGPRPPGPLELQLFRRLQTLSPQFWAHGGPREVISLTRGPGLSRVCSAAAPAGPGGDSLGAGCGLSI